MFLKVKNDPYFQNLTETIGCTTPFVKNKSNICTDPDKAEKAYFRQIDILKGDQFELQKICPYPYLQVSSFYGSQNEIKEEELTIGLGVPTGNLFVLFKPFIRVSESYWSYTGLSLIAEVGGYVGLFLGVSINQITYLIDKVMKYKKIFYVTLLLVA